MMLNVKRTIENDAYPISINHHDLSKNGKRDPLPHVGGFRLLNMSL